MRHPTTGMLTLPSTATAPGTPVSPVGGDVPHTPTTSEAFTRMRTKVEYNSASLGPSSTSALQKMMKGFEKTLCPNALLSAGKGVASGAEQRKDITHVNSINHCWGPESHDVR